MTWGRITFTFIVTTVITGRYYQIFVVTAICIQCLHIFFLFQENPCQHPVIILKDVSADDILSLLSYMYQGEVFIEESKLSSFLHTAALLQVKGLTGVTQQVR